MDNNMELVYLKSLAKQFPTIASASTEIINLEAIMNLPKGTEHFLTDIHGEYEQFNHVLKNGSGSVRSKIDEEFGNTLSLRDKKSLATLIYYPVEKLEIVQEEEDNLEDWYKITLHRLVQMTKRVSSKVWLWWPLLLQSPVAIRAGVKCMMRIIKTGSFSRISRLLS